MRVVLSTIGTFHLFDLARELHTHAALTQIFTGYPHFKLKGHGLPEGKVRCFPWVHGPFMALAAKWNPSSGWVRAWEQLDRSSFDHHVSRHIPAADVFVGMSGSTLYSGRVARERGMRFVCDRGSSHIVTQDRLLREEERLWGLPERGVDPWVVEREMAEYEAADSITVPSSFSVRSFTDQGVPASKLRYLPYGVNFTKFRPAAPPDGQRFDVLFAGAMSLRKGVPYLLKAFQRLAHPKKSLTFAGAVSPSLISLMKSHGLWSDHIQVLGHIDQERLRHIMSRSHVTVLPSIEDGFGLVMAQAMACGCPVIASEHTGAVDLYEHGRHGFIVPIRRSDLLADALQQLADTPSLRDSMSAASLERVQQINGWAEYGKQAMRIYTELLT